MKAIIILFLFLTAGPLSIFSETIKGSGVLKKEERFLAVFKKIELKNSANVYIVQGDEQNIRIEADENLVPHILTTVSKNTLAIFSKKDFFTTKPINIYLMVKDLSAIELSGSGNIKTLKNLTCPLLTIKSTGSGNIDASIKSNTVKIQLTGSGNIELKGEAAFSDIQLSGNGNIESEVFKSGSSTISLTGSGNCTVDVSDRMTIDITGSGNVYYHSKPELLIGKIKGRGKILQSGKFGIHTDSFN